VQDAIADQWGQHLRDRRARHARPRPDRTPQAAVG
jgi:hypothetical protein